MNINPFTDQEAFNVMVHHLRRQGCKSTIENPVEYATCRYRGEEGRMCVVGVLVPNKNYKVNMEGKNARAIISENVILQELLGVVNISMLGCMQDIHDTKDPHTWEDHFRSVAERYGLTVPEKLTPINTGE